MLHLSWKLRRQNCQPQRWTTLNSSRHTNVLEALQGCLHGWTKNSTAGAQRGDVGGVLRRKDVIGRGKGIRQRPKARERREGGDGGWREDRKRNVAFYRAERHGSLVFLWTRWCGRGRDQAAASLGEKAGCLPGLWSLKYGFSVWISQGLSRPVCQPTNSHFLCCRFKVTTCLDHEQPLGKQGLIWTSADHEAREGGPGNNGFQLLQYQILLLIILNFEIMEKEVSRWWFCFPFKNTSIQQERVMFCKVFLYFR